MPLMRTLSPDEQDATTALAEHLIELSSLSNKGVGHPDFINWKTATQKTFEQYLSGSVFSSRFANICFDKPFLASSSDICMTGDFMEGLAIAKTCLEEAIEYVEQFGLKNTRT